jgi:hypothetical protein
VDPRTLALSREQIALNLLSAWLGSGVPLTAVGRNEMVAIFGIAKLFEDVSHEVGGRPCRTTGRVRNDYDDD